MARYPPHLFTMSEFKLYREESRKNYGTSAGIDLDKLKTGALLRIADATEKMAQNYDALLQAKKSAEEGRNYWRSESERMARRINSLRGVITRMKKGRQ